MTLISEQEYINKLNKVDEYNNTMKSKPIDVK